MTNQDKVDIFILVAQEAWEFPYPLGDYLTGVVYDLGDGKISLIKALTKLFEEAKRYG